MASAADIKRYRQNLQDEVDGSAMYLALANIEEEPSLIELYKRLLAKSDDELERGRLPREEVEDGLAQLRARSR